MEADDAERRRAGWRRMLLPACLRPPRLPRDKPDYHVQHRWQWGTSREGKKAVRVSPDGNSLSGAI